MNKIYILLGTNLGNRLENLANSIQLLNEKVGRVILTSSIYETAPWGNEDQPPFLNQVVLIETPLNPQDLLASTQTIEYQLGRKRIQHWGARTIDIDILYYNDDIIDETNLQIPHPQIQHRLFTLKPLAEIAPDFMHPNFELTNLQLLQNCLDRLEVKKIN